MKYYSLDPITKEYTGFNEVAQIDPKESELAGEDVYLCPAHATLVQPPETGANEVAVWDDELERWNVLEDFRGQKYWNRQADEFEITEIGETVPTGPDFTLEPPPEYPDMVQPKLHYNEWVEGAIVFMNERGDPKPVTTKAKVDIFTARKIRVAGVGEEKAKTLKILAGEDPCPEFDEWLELRNALVDEGNQFIIDNDLS
jgi:hypothetical protein